MSPRLSDLLLHSQSDERLVGLATSGHDRAFATIVERYRPELLAHARRLVSDGRAEDVLQQAFLSAFAALRSGTEVRHVRGWLHQIVRNAAGKSRSPRELPLDEVTASGPALEDVVLERATVRSTMTEVARLPERQRDALVGMALGGLGRAELATSMGLSEGAVRQLVHRARTTVRGAVTAITPWPLARWLAALPGTPDGASELAATAGAVSGGGIALKLGAVLTTAAVATGVAVVPEHHHDRARAVPVPAAHARAAGPSAASLVAPAGVSLHGSSGGGARAAADGAGASAARRRDRGGETERHRGHDDRGRGGQSHGGRSLGIRSEDHRGGGGSGARSGDGGSGARSGDGGSGSRSGDGGSGSGSSATNSGREGRGGSSELGSSTSSGRDGGGSHSGSGSASDSAGHVS